MSTPIPLNRVAEMPRPGFITPPQPGDESPPYSHARPVDLGNISLKALGEDDAVRERNLGVRKALEQSANPPDYLKDNKYLNPSKQGGRKRKSKKSKRKTRKAGRRRTRGRKTRSG